MKASILHHKTSKAIVLATASLMLSILSGHNAWANHVPDHIGLVEVGPLPVDDPLTPENEANGFPLFYTDANGVSLELCLGSAANGNLPDPNCVVTTAPFPNLAISFPDNFGVEAFYQLARVFKMDLIDGGTASWTGALEASFLNGAIVKPGEQMAFARNRIKIFMGSSGAGHYRVFHPYGRVNTNPGTAGFICTPEIYANVAVPTPGKAAINDTNDVGLTPGVFTDALNGGIGPFLQAVSPAPPVGYIGTPAIGVLVAGTSTPAVGSPPQKIANPPCGPRFNRFRVEYLPLNQDPNTAPDSAWTLLGEATDFELYGKKINTTGGGPIARNDVLKMENVANPLPLAVLSNDVPRINKAINKASLAIGVTSPANGTAVPITNLVDPNVGKVLYTPAAGFIGADTFSYTVFDNTAPGAACTPSAVPPVVVCPPPFKSNEATVQIDVLAATPPTAADDTVSTAEDVPVSINILQNDTDNVAINPASVVIVAPGPANGTALVNPNGTILYTPNANFNGNDTFQYTVNDFNGGISNSATVSATVTPVNDPPVANNDIATATVNTPVDISILSNDTDPDGVFDIDPTSVKIVGIPPAGATLTVDTVNGRVKFVSSTIGAYSFNYSFSDLSKASSNVGKVDVTVIAPPPPPIANLDSVNTPEDVPVSINVLQNDTSSAGIKPASVALLAPAPLHGAALVNADGTISYTPNANFNGSDAFSYTVQDVNGLVSNQAKVVVTVTAVNDPPVANDDVAEATANKSVDIPVLGNDTDIDGITDIDSASLQLVGALPNGVTLTANSNGKVSFISATPGTYTFHYQVKDLASASSNIAKVDVTVIAPPPPPIANPDSVNTPEDVPVSINVLQNDTSSAGIKPASVALLAPAPLHGAALVNADGTISYTPNANFNGSDAFSYTVQDVNGLVSNQAKIVVTVTAVNDPPVANDDVAEATANKSADIPVLGNDSDIDGITDIDSASLQLVGALPNGVTLTANSNGNVSFVSATPGTYTFHYQVKDLASASSNIAKVDVTVIAPPIANPDSVNTPEDVPVSINVLQNDTSSAGINPATVALLAPAPLHGSAIVNADGTISYTPNANFNGSDAFSYTVQGGTSLVSNQAKVVVTVTAVNDPPVANDDVAEATANKSVDIPVLGNDSDIDGITDIDSASLQLVGALPNGAALTANSNGNVSFVSATPGTYTFHYQIKDLSSASSNIAKVDVTVSAAPPASSAPDLSSAWQTNPVQVCNKRSICTLNVRHLTTNNGPGMVKTKQRVKVRLYLSNDETLDAEDTLLKQSNLGSLKQGSSKVKTFRVKLPGGNALGKFVVAKTDASNILQENDEANNVVVFAIP